MKNGKRYDYMLLLDIEFLNLFDDTLDLAEYVYGHHERWDGSGYPRGRIKGKEQIPLISRIITAVETYDRVLHRENYPLETRKIEAKKIIAGRWRNTV